VDKFSGNRYKGFRTRAEAEASYHEHLMEEMVKRDRSIVIPPRHLAEEKRMDQSTVILTTGMIVITILLMVITFLLYLIVV
jgi:hypothetical protein